MLSGLRTGHWEETHAHLEISFVLDFYEETVNG